MTELGLAVESSFGEKTTSKQRRSAGREADLPAVFADWVQIGVTSLMVRGCRVKH